MSRRARHGRNPHQHASARPGRPGVPALDDAQATADVRVAAPPEIEVAAPVVDPTAAIVTATVPPARPAPEPVRAPAPVHAPEPARPVQPVRAAESVRGSETVRFAEPEPARDRPRESESDAGHSQPTCTQAQLRRFIKSRPWVPMHELRRRFGIYGGDDDVSPIRVGDRTLFIGLPPPEGRMMGELLGAGDVGCELSLDPVAPVVIGVYPMRPVPRS